VPAEPVTADLSIFRRAPIIPWSAHRPIGGARDKEIAAMRNYRVAGVMVAGALVGGCGFLEDLIQGQRRVNVRLVNTGDDPVEVRLFFDDTQEIPSDLLSEVGQEIEVTLAPREVYPFSRPCADLQAIVIDRADVNFEGVPIGPSDNTRVFRDGDDFACGQTLSFRFTYTVIPPNLDITFSAE
jgi:hypothetical protein